MLVGVVVGWLVGNANVCTKEVLAVDVHRLVLVSMSNIAQDMSNEHTHTQCWRLIKSTMSR